MALNRYNIRVYGLCLNRAGQILLTDERRSGYLMTKFPGGGHQIGESLAECLIREFQEELMLEVKVDELFYINDFLQVSAFNPSDQILSVYYWVHALAPLPIELVSARFAFPEGNHDAQTFRWMDVDALCREDLTFPIDRVVLETMQEKIRQNGLEAYQRLSQNSLL